MLEDDFPLASTHEIWCRSLNNLRGVYGRALMDSRAELVIAAQLAEITAAEPTHLSAMANA